jgi:hypothetical protein
MSSSSKSRQKDLEIDLACVSWARRQKEREVRNVLVASKEMKRSDVIEKVLLANNMEEKQRKKSNVIDDELSRRYIFRDDDLYRLRAEEESEKRKHQKVKVCILVL